MLGLEVDRDGPVATLRMAPIAQVVAQGPTDEDIHIRLGQVLDELGDDPEVRVILLTGAADGEFLVPPPTSHYREGPSEGRLVAPSGVVALTRGVIRTHLSIACIDKPVIARVNGDAIGFGQSLLLACDLIIAREDALISDVHLGMGEVKRSDGTPVGPGFGVAPGDGAGALAMLYMTPPLAKEYLMLSKTMTAAEMCAAGLINRAVPMAELDAAVTEVVDGLLRRPATSIAWTKHLVNQRVLSRLVTSNGASIAFEMLDFQFHAYNARHPGKEQQS